MRKVLETFQANKEMDEWKFSSRIEERNWNLIGKYYTKSNPILKTSSKRLLAIQLKWVFSSDDAPLLVIMMVLYYYNAPFYLYFDWLFSLSVVQCFFCDCGCKVFSYLVSRFGFMGVDISYVLKKPTWQMVLLTNFVKGFGFCLSRYPARELALYVILYIKIKHLFFFFLIRFIKRNVDRLTWQGLVPEW